MTKTVLIVVHLFLTLVFLLIGLTAWEEAIKPIERRRGALVFFLAPIWEVFLLVWVFKSLGLLPWRNKP